MNQQQQHHWVIRIGMGDNFWRSYALGVYGIGDQHASHKKFLNEAKKGDTLWFIMDGKEGQAVAVASLESIVKRNVHDVLSGTPSDQMYGWNGEHWTHEVRYYNAVDLSTKAVYTYMKGIAPLRLYFRRSYDEGLFMQELYYTYDQVIQSRIKT